MDARSSRLQPATHTLELYADAAHTKDIVKGILHTIFFHRTFLCVSPVSRDIPDLNTTLPAVDDVDIEQLISDRAGALARQLVESSETFPGTSTHGHLAVQFHEKRRIKSPGFFGLREADEEICWETWILDVTFAAQGGNEDIKGIMERSIGRAAMKIVEIAGREKDHIPPITSANSESTGNPFPYQIILGKPGGGLTLGAGGRGTSTAAAGGLW